MRVLVEVVHPAHVLFFLNPIKAMKSRGDQIMIVSRFKDVTCDLLDRFGLEHKPLSTAGEGKLGLAKELIIRDSRLFCEVRKFKPEIMLGFGGVAISHVGKLLGIPSVSFYDTDTAKLQNGITWPFITHLYVPEAFAGPVPKGRTSRWNGGKELSYFHPENFLVENRIARKNGWDEKCDNFFIRTVSWRANHDIGKVGWSVDTLFRLVKKLDTLGRVHISSENKLPANFDQYRYDGDKTEVHHLLAKCRLYVGESATMASEAAMLGVPAIYDGCDHPGSTLAQADANLLEMLSQRGSEDLLACVERMLKNDVVQKLKLARASYLSQRPNLAKLVVEAADQHALKKVA